MLRLLPILLLSFIVVLSPACRSKSGGSGSPGISRPNRGGGTGAGPGIYKPKYVGAGHTPRVTGSKKKRDTFSTPTRQHGKR